MKVLLFGATGMVGQGVLRECLLDTSVTSVVTIGRTASGVLDPKVHDVVHEDLANYSAIEADLTGFDACFFCLGVSAAGMKEADYERITYGITLAAAETLSRLYPGMTFIYVSGEGTDSTEKGRSMWARVKGKTENALLKLPFKAAYMFRPGFIQSVNGERSKTALYRAAYVVTKPLLPLLMWAAPSHVTTTEEVGRGMLAAAKHGASKKILENKDIRALTSTDVKS
jgi:uncharacterized protein YbjT (DUF2867 family)